MYASVHALFQGFWAYGKQMCDDNVPEQHVPVLRERAVDDGCNLHLISSSGSCSKILLRNEKAEMPGGAYLLSAGQVPVKQA